jgi:hypothetical protein
MDESRADELLMSVSAGKVNYARPFASQLMYTT